MELSKGVKCLILDDSTLNKSGLKIENMGKVWDHTLNRSVLGFKMLACSFWDGVSNIPLDFSLHREKGKNKKKPYGIKKRVLQRQSKKDQIKGNPGKKRREEVNMNKIEVGIQMIKRAVKRGFVPDFVISDCWFFCLKLLKTVRKLKNGKVHLLSMCKMGKILFTWRGKEYSPGNY